VDYGLDVVRRYLRLNMRTSRCGRNVTGSLAGVSWIEQFLSGRPCHEILPGNHRRLIVASLCAGYAPNLDGEQNCSSMLGVAYFAPRLFSA